MIQAKQIYFIIERLNHFKNTKLNKTEAAGK